MIQFYLISDQIIRLKNTPQGTKIVGKNVMKRITYIILCLVVVWSCTTTKNIPDGKYLMDNYRIKTDSKDIDITYLEDFVRQQPNNKIRLAIYDLAGQDTSKWRNRFIQKLGQAPVVYNPQLTHVSSYQIARELNNQGYLRAKVDTLLKFKDKKVDITYDIKTNGIYKIRNYEFTIENESINKSLFPARKYTRIQPGVVFNQANLETSRENLTSYLRNTGYYNFSKEYLYFKVDTTLQSHQADVFLSLYQPRDSTSYKKFKIRNVSILSGFDPSSRMNQILFKNPDTINYKGIEIIRGKNDFLRNSTLFRNNYIHPGRYYSDFAYTLTTGAFNSIGIIKQTDVTFHQVTENANDSIQYLDANITLVPGNVHFLQTEIQGTNSAGDLGIAPSITYQHQNLFNGAEIFKARLRGAYEFIDDKEKTGLSNSSYYEFGVNTSLSFPLFLFPWMKRSWREQPSASTELSAGINNQHRKEYTRQFFDAAITYRWTSKQRQLTHALSLFNINYVRMPYRSATFDSLYINNPSPSYAMIRESYKDQLIASTTYGITYTNSNMRFGRVPTNQTTIRANIDLSGWLPSLMSRVFKVEKDSLGKKQIAGISYAQYAKGDVSFARSHRIDARNTLAYHIGVGVAVPFGNSDVLPFEARYFSGGANSVRGWRTRELGPGAYQRDSLTSFVNTVGDIKLDLNIEYRKKLTDLFELAGFIDAGNVWTIRNYAAQPKGLFQFSNFYKEIAIAYGVGFRLDFEYLLLRLDFGFKAYDPSRNEGDRWVTPNFGGNRMAWHFGIGYPF